MGTCDMSGELIVLEVDKSIRLKSVANKKNSNI